MHDLFGWSYQLLNKFFDDARGVLRFSLQKQVGSRDDFDPSLRFYSPNFFET